MLSRLRSLWRALTHRSAFERDMDDELQFHLDSRVEALVKTGLPRHHAMRQARLEFGNPEAHQDRCRESRGLRLVDDLIIDLRFALRTMRRDAGLSATVILTVALGIGATSAIGSVVYGVLMRPLPFPEPERLMMVGASSPKESFMPVAGPDFVEWREGCHVCDAMAAYAGTWLSNLTGGSEPDRVRIGRVSGDFFRTMGVQPMLGRTFLPEETGRSIFGIGTGTPLTAVILGHGLWQRRFGGDPAIVGRAVSVEGDPCTVVGVMPAGFSFPANSEAWVPAGSVQSATTPICRWWPGCAQDSRSRTRTAIWRSSFAGSTRGRRTTSARLTSRSARFASTSWATSERRCSSSWAPWGSSC